MKKVYTSDFVRPRRRGKPEVRWKDGMREYMHERVANRGRGFVLAIRKCFDR